MKNRTDEIEFEGVCARFEKLDKKTCEKWLAALHPNQRMLKQSHFASLMRDIDKGEWVMIGDPIRFDVDGMLIDGQHRLQAFLKKGFFPTVLVVSGLSHAAYPLIDGCSPRSLADMFKEQGIPNYVVSSAISSSFAYYDAKNAFYGKLTKSEVLEAYHRHEASIEWARTKWAQLDHVISRSRRGFLAALAFEAYGEDVAASFFDAMITGIGGSPALAFRKRMIVESNKSRGKLSTREVMALGIKALRAFGTGRSLHSLKWPQGEPFPRLEVAA